MRRYELGVRSQPLPEQGTTHHGVNRGVLDWVLQSRPELQPRPPEPSERTKTFVSAGCCLRGSSLAEGCHSRAKPGRIPNHESGIGCVHRRLSKRRRPLSRASVSSVVDLSWSRAAAMRNFEALASVNSTRAPGSRRLSGRRGAQFPPAKSANGGGGHDRLVAKRTRDACDVLRIRGGGQQADRFRDPARYHDQSGAKGPGVDPIGVRGSQRCEPAKALRSRGQCLLEGGRVRARECQWRLVSVRLSIDRQRWLRLLVDDRRGDTEPAAVAGLVRGLRGGFRLLGAVVVEVSEALLRQSRL
jgi:hypothetical protein